MNFLNLIISAVFVSACCSVKHGPLRSPYGTSDSLNVRSGNPGKPLFLTPFIEDGRIDEARNLSRVRGLSTKIESYSGFLTVNKTHDSNIFFWFFPAQHNPEKAPLLLWLQGGPGGSSLFGLFVENGPFGVDSKLKLFPRKFSWTLSHSIVYMDNPVGTGFSFTKDDAGYARNQLKVGWDLYHALLQFFTLFPRLQNNQFFATGESYAGKYVPAVAYRIHKENPRSKLKINLKGFAIGDGLCDPETMTNYGDFLYDVGLIDRHSQSYFHNQSRSIINLIRRKQWRKAFSEFDSLLNGDLSGVPSYFTNVTGLTFYFNYLMTQSPKDFDYYSTFLNNANVRKAIHVGNLTYHSGIAVEKHLLEDVMKSAKPWIQILLNAKYSILFYNGQLDIIIANSLTDNFINSLKWNGAHDYYNAARNIYMVDGEVVGYYKVVRNLVQVLVRNAGHILPYDQPKWAYDLIHRFTSGKFLEITSY